MQGWLVTGQFMWGYVQVCERTDHHNFFTAKLQCWDGELESHRSAVSPWVL